MILWWKARTIRRVALTLVVACALTLYGFLNYWQGIEAPDSKNHALAIVLLLPIAALSTLFRAISNDGHLSPWSYRLVLVIGSAGQFLYYHMFVVLMDRVVTALIEARWQRKTGKRS